MRYETRRCARYWEVVESYRRLLFMSALVVVDTPSRRAFFGASLTLVGAVVYRELAPYQRSSTNVLNLTVQYQVFAVFVYAAQLLQHDGTGYTGALAGVDEESVGAMIVAVNLR